MSPTPHFTVKRSRTSNAKTDPYALIARCWQVVAESIESQLKANDERGLVSLDFTETVAQLTRFETGPLQAKAFLAQHGIAFVISLQTCDPLGARAGI